MDGRPDELNSCFIVAILEAATSKMVNYYFNLVAIIFVLSLYLLRVISLKGNSFFSKSKNRKQNKYSVFFFFKLHFFET